VGKTPVNKMCKRDILIKRGAKKRETNVVIKGRLNIIHSFKEEQRGTQV